MRRKYHKSNGECFPVEVCGKHSFTLDNEAFFFSVFLEDIYHSVQKDKNKEFSGLLRANQSAQRRFFKSKTYSKVQSPRLEIFGQIGGLLLLI